MRTAILTFVLVSAAAAAAADRPPVGVPAPASVDSPVPGATLETQRTCGYTMAGKIRPLFFWIGRDDVGLARIAWRRGQDGVRGYELLVGTDPARAPRGINRWGYIAEEIAGADGDLAAVMSRSEETSFGDAQTNVERRSSRGDFQAIHARVREGVATSYVAPIQTSTPLTIHDLAALLDNVQVQMASASPRTVPALPGVRPGFLVAVAELIDRSLAAAPLRGFPESLEGESTRYVFGMKLYELRLKSMRRVDDWADGDRRVGPVVRAGFEIRTLSTDARTRFEIVYPAAGDLAGVPLEMSWQPRWWLKVELRLDDPTASCGGAMTARR